MRRAHRSHGGYPGSWLNRSACLLSRTYLIGLVVLALAAGAPLLLGWTAAVDLTPTGGDDRPSGAVILAAPPSVSGFRRGEHLLVDVSGTGQLSVRTVGEIRPGGRLMLTPEGPLPRTTVSPSAVVAVRKAAVPLIGLPAVWWRTGHPAYTASWVAATLLALVSATGTGAAPHRIRERKAPARLRRSAEVARPLES